MRCHNHQVADSSNNSDHNIMKQVRFASDNNSNSESQEKPCETGVNGDLQIQFGPQLKLLSRNDLEEGLNQLPYTECIVTTPTGHKYEGVKFERGNCGISIMRSGEAMEQGLRDCCRSIRIGKILIQCNGNTVIKAVRVLNEHVVQPLHIILLSLFSTPHGKKFPDITILTTEVHPIAPSHFGQKYFGTE
uniref:Phosphoribosyltransferase domain-containing protein n=1 Tax=Electrophorus electricus TaxID=8005 RepID=A0A4W4F467_ELEEL